MTHLWVFCRAMTATVVFIFFSALSYGSGVTEQGAESWWRGGSAEEGGDHGVKRSPSDDRAYRYLRLDNGLQVLLISDPNTDKSAASMNVNVGSFQNPEGREGLAHFLEHMLFLGTDKYPEAGAYQKFIGEHGGQHNAYTSMEDTNYFFDVEAKHFLAALNRFSRFFIAPSFDKAYVDRERNAVESEFRLKLKDDSRRGWEVFSEQVDPEHPLSTFSVGNLETLADRENDPVRPDLLAFYKQYYAAERMTLVMLSRERLGQLEVVVRGLFSAVPAATEPGATKSADTGSAADSSMENEDKSIRPSFKKSLPYQLNIVPLKDQRKLSITFPMATIEDHWRIKPDMFWGHLLGDESEGSLIAELKKAGLANGLSAGQAFDTSHGASFMVQIALTPEGVEQQTLVLDRLFAWLNLARNEGIRPWRFKELALLLQTQFRFAEKISPSSYVQGLSSALRHYPPEEVLRGPYLLSDFDQRVMAEFADHLKPENALITLLAPEVEAADHISARYAAPYRIDYVGEWRLKHWQKAADTSLSLAPTNPYLAKAYPLSGKGGESSVPVALKNQLDTTIWHYDDQQFGTPRGLFDARIATPVLNTCRNAALAELYLAMVRDALGEETYQAGLAGLSYSLYRWHNGVGVNVSGYTDRQAVLLSRVLQALAESQWQESDFARLRSTLIRNYRNSLKQWPVRQVFAQFGPLMKGACDDQTLANHLEAVSLEDMPAFHGRLFKTGHARFYAGGALSAEQSLAMARSTMKALALGEAGDIVLHETVLALPEQVQRHSIEVDHNDKAVLLYIQGDEDTLGERAAMAMINIAMEAPFYTTMRTEKQLGYVVGANLMHINRVPGLGFYIQSPTSSAAQIEQEINAYLLAFESKLVAMSKAELQGLKAALLANIQERPKNIMQQAARHQESLMLGEDDFKFRDKLAEKIKTLDQESFVATYRRLVSEDSRRLWITTTAPESDFAPVNAELLADEERVFAYPE
ncbi:MAG: insulinase family protein [Porticoccaceae bacterium]|nr:insulinase family protein [Porticoccaceae bacterium]